MANGIVNVASWYPVKVTVTSTAVVSLGELLSVGVDVFTCPETSVSALIELTNRSEGYVTPDTC
jgi:hypothetical protein